MSIKKKALVLRVLPHKIM